MAVGIIEPQNFPSQAQQELRKIWRLILGPSRTTAQAPEIEGLFCRLGVYLGEDFLTPFKNLKWIASPTTALSHIDTVHASKMGIKVYSLRDVSPGKLQKLTSTVDLTVFLTLAIARNYLRLVNTPLGISGWDRYAHPSKQLSSHTIGIIGLGRIGSRVCQTLSSLGATVVGFDSKNFPDKQSLSEPCKTVEELLAVSDIVVMCASYQNGQAPILSRKRLAVVKPGVKIINTARGELVDELAVGDLIRKGIIEGYATDTLAGEAVNDHWNSPILSLLQEGYNVIVTPHVGGASSDSLALSEALLATHIVEKFR